MMQESSPSTMTTSTSQPYTTTLDSHLLLVEDCEEYDSEFSYSDDEEETQRDVSSNRRRQEALLLLSKLDPSDNNKSKSKKDSCHNGIGQQQLSSSSASSATVARTKAAASTNFDSILDDKKMSSSQGERLPLLASDEHKSKFSGTDSDSLTPTTATPPASVLSSSANAAALLETPIIHVMDRLEDEMEAHTYEDLVPLEVKLALEDKVFGWTHLTSTFIGHTVFTVGAYWIVYTAITLACTNQFCFGFSSMYQQQQLQGQQQYYSNGVLPTSFSIHDASMFQFVRTFFAAWAALSAYRMVRRRRRVWFRTSYGSKAYKRDEARRRQMVQETDRTTIMGRMIRKVLERRVYKKLRKAEGYYAKKHQRLQQARLQNIQEDETRNYNNNYNCNYNATNSKRSEEPFHRSLSAESSESTGSSCCSSSSDEEGVAMLVQNDTVVTQQQQQKDGSTDVDASLVSSPSGLHKRHRRPSFHTDPTNQMQSIGHDQVLFQTIHNMPYAHGGFFGAAPFLLANPHWISILRHLLPDVYVEISRRVLKSPAPKLIHWAENNPVVAAYGAAHALEYNNVTTTNDSLINHDQNRKSGIPNLEWDVFLDPHLIHRVQVVLDARDKYLESLRSTTTSTTSPTVHSDDEDDDSDDDDEVHNDKVVQQKTLKSPSNNTNSKHILAFYDQELERRSKMLVDKMLIAHGNLNHLILEVAGYAKRYNYSRVKRTRRSLGGGIYARQWMAVFAEALKLGLRFDDLTKAVVADTTGLSGINSIPINEQGKNVIETKTVSQKTTSLLALAESKCPNMTMAESNQVVRSIAKCEQPIGLVLDIKSRHVPKRIWSIVVDTLRQSGLRVEGLGSFYMHEIRDISQYCHLPVQEIYFFHSAGDVQRACHDSRIRKGDKVFFNAGSLLWDPAHLPSLSEISSFDPNSVKKSYQILPFACSNDSCDASSNDQRSSMTSTLQMYKKRFDLSIGMYCQEFAIDEIAADLLAKHVNSNPHIYDLGLSWGGVNGITVKGICPGRFTSTDGFWNQRYLGCTWDDDLLPPPEETEVARPGASGRKINGTVKHG